MKNVFTLVCSLFIYSSITAQYCGVSGYTSCTPDSSLPAPGITNFNSFPCVTQGVAFSSSFQLYIPHTITYGQYTANIDSIRIDSITNLPCGLCWSSDTSTQIIKAQERACVNISGTTNDSAGMYPIEIYVDVYLPYGTLRGLRLSQVWSNFCVFVIPPGGSCLHSVSSTPLRACGAAQRCVATPVIQQQNVGGGCILNIVNLATTNQYSSYIWTNSMTGDTLYTPTIQLPYMYRGYVNVSVVDSNHCAGTAESYLYNAGSIESPAICYFTSDTALSYPNVTVAFERDNGSNNVVQYILIGQDGILTPGTVVNSLSPSSPGYLTDSIYLHASYSVAAISTCGDTTWSPFYFVYSQLSLDTIGGYPHLSWSLQLPANYSSIAVLARPVGGTWAVKDTLYSITAFNQTLTYTDLHPDSSLMEYVLAYTINTNCDPHKSLTQKTVFTNIVKTQVAPTSVSDITGHSLIQVYPNPAFDFLNVVASKEIIAIASKVKIYDMVGKLLDEESLNGSDSRINISTYTKGVYLLKVTGQNEDVLTIRKFIKE